MTERSVVLKQDGIGVGARREEEKCDRDQKRAQIDFFGRSVHKSSPIFFDDTIVTHTYE